MAGSGTHVARRRRGASVVAVVTTVALALVVAACGTPTATTAPSAPAPTASWNPRVAEIDAFEAVWEAQQPPAYACTMTHTIDGTGWGGAARVTHLDGRTESMPLTAGTDDGSTLTVEGLFDTARLALNGADGRTTYEVNHQYAYLVSLAHESTAADGSFHVDVTDFTTPGDRAAAERARGGLDALLARWAAYASPAWEYTWTRFGAKDTAASATSWTVRHRDGRTTGVLPDGSSGGGPAPDATIAGTVAGAMAVLGAGGWVDVSTDQETGLSALIAVDPSPSASGDAYWIRIAVQDLANRAARTALGAAQDRWAAAAPRRYSYAWSFEDGDRTWRYTVAMKGDVASIKASGGAPTGEAAPIAPRIADLLAAIDSTLARGGTVSATYDKRLGYPTKVVVAPGSPDLPAGTYTITAFNRG